MVNGGTAGIGRATVERLLAEGASVVFCACTPNKGEAVVAELPSPRLVFAQADVTRRHDPEELYGRTLERFGRLDVVVDNAGNLVVAPALTPEAGALAPNDGREGRRRVRQLPVGHPPPAVHPGRGGGRREHHHRERGVARVAVEDMLVTLDDIS